MRTVFFSRRANLCGLAARSCLLFATTALLAASIHVNQKRIAQPDRAFLPCGRSASPSAMGSVLHSWQAGKALLPAPLNQAF